MSLTVNKRLRRVLYAFPAGMCALLPIAAVAQVAPSASSVTPKSLAPERLNGASSITLPEAPRAAAPAGLESLRVRIGDVAVDGGSPQFSGIIAREVARISRREDSVAELYGAAAQIEQAYARAGYVLTRVTVPPQNLVDGGTFRLVIIDGYIESVDAGGVPGHLRKAVQRRLDALIGVHGLTLAQIERRVLLAGEVPGVTLRSALVRGSAIGAAKLVLAGDYRPVSPSLSTENDVGGAYLHQSISTQIVLNSPLGLGEQIYFQGTSGPDFNHLFKADSRRRILGAGIIAPLGTNGLKVNAEFARVDTTPRVAQGGLATKGVFERFAVRVNYPLIRTRRETLNFLSSFELTKESQTATDFDQLLNADRLRIISIGGDWSKTLGNRRSISVSALFSQGLDGLGARNADDVAVSSVPFSRQGSQPDFTRVSGTVRLDAPLGRHVALSTTLRGQFAVSGAMPASAQFSLDGSDGLSSFSLGTLSVDSGVTGRAEISRPIRIKRPEVQGFLTPYAFSAVSYGNNVDPTALEARNIGSWAAGAGLRVLLSPPKSGITSLGALEISRGHASNFTADTTRVSVNFSVRY